MLIDAFEGGNNWSAVATAPMLISPSQITPIQRCINAGLDSPCTPEPTDPSVGADGCVRPHVCWFIVTMDLCIRTWGIVAWLRLRLSGGRDLDGPKKTRPKSQSTTTTTPTSTNPHPKTHSALANASFPMDAAHGFGIPQPVVWNGYTADAAGDCQEGVSGCDGHAMYV